MTAASSASLSGLRMVAMTFQPLEANSRAVARPSPVDAPVMKMVCDIEVVSVPVLPSMTAIRADQKRGPVARLSGRRRWRPGGAVIILPFDAAPTGRADTAGRGRSSTHG